MPETTYLVPAVSFIFGLFKPLSSGSVLSLLHSKYNYTKSEAVYVTNRY